MLPSWPSDAVPRAMIRWNRRSRARLLSPKRGMSQTAVYLHGSAVAEGLRRHSDVDLLAVMEGSLSASARRDLAADLMAVYGRYPFDREGRRPLEVIVFRSADLVRLPYPARAELVYGEWLRGAFEGGAVPDGETTPEFTLVLAQAREQAVPLFGPAVTERVPDIPFPHICRAIGDLLPDLVAGAEGDERNVLLTLARMWATISTGRFLSKAAAADWAAPQLTNQAAGALLCAKRSYPGQGSFDVSVWHAELGLAVDEMRQRIMSML